MSGAHLSPLRGCVTLTHVDPGLAPWATFLRRSAARSNSTPTPDTLPTHIPARFDILGHRADDLVVPDPGPEHRSRFSGRIGSLPSSAQPYEGWFLQGNPRQRVTVTPAHFRS